MHRPADPRRALQGCAHVQVHHRPVQVQGHRRSSGVRALQAHSGAECSQRNSREHRLGPLPSASGQAPTGERGAMARGRGARLRCQPCQPSG
eukprot:1790607-Pyramimonas_sp.AAC.1